MFNCTLLSRSLNVSKNVFQCYCNNVAKNKINVKGYSKENIIKTYGQPTSNTHPHLIRPGEITTGIAKHEFEQRRQKFVEKLLTSALKNENSAKQHIIVIPSASKSYMSDKIPYVFRQNSDYLYLTGCQEPDTCLVITTTTSSQDYKVILFLRNKDSHSELWDGPRTGIEDASNFFGVNQGLPMTELETFLNLYFKSHPQTMLWYDFLTPIQGNIHNIMKKLQNGMTNNFWDTPVPFVHELRLIKSPAEIQLMQKSCDVASEAIMKSIIHSKPGSTEHEIFATVDYECRMNGAEFLAYPPVVAGGNRATIIHYINNNQVVNDGEMVLMDAGCEYHGYSSDITRTWPINGKFTPQQRIIYEIVETVQAQIIQWCAHFPSLDQLFDSMCILLGKYLQEVGLIPKKASQKEVIRGAYSFCPHHVSHYLGMDVHDTPSIPRKIKIVPGMIITVEPGIYISNQLNVPEEFRGIGVRIEDDVLITESGPVVLSAKCRKSREDIEKIAFYCN
ncbi:xaa-Pro aminopeptidase 3 [Agrilus planipennis]|uniref:Xaa-Pro aminopeptidase 3 n=1 Tax=Agrilus planipennis TaxID=224129 RepID=A0A1W4X3V9_AGRPL|nr:xaa-Pro aminopeptidase 3 [Agrilus planipennis]